MHPIIQHQLMNARIADLHRQADHDRLARAATKARRLRHEEGRRLVGGRPATVLARCLHAVLPARPIARPPAAA
jgi:hypothetical protein